ncbi:MAG: threonine ammonia-lyase, biosynthetic [Rhodospirillaceae bacterium]|nr:threonine ammonia-lyase, biosynthetic [Rhodospirillaceae bacterium]
MPQKYLKMILNAPVYDVAHETPLDIAPRLSEKLDNKVLIKREDLQPVFSFKLRGAYNKLINLTSEQKRRGVVAASAGNHAQGVALAADKLNIEATIVMPQTTPDIKIEGVKKFGACVVLYGDDFSSAFTKAQEIATKTTSVFIPPFDDPLVIAGQGTIGIELLRQCMEDIHAIFIPIGGGGLISGIGAYVKMVRPDIKIIGVESDESASMRASLEKGRRVTLKNVGIFADGVAVAKVGKEPFRLAKKVVDEVIVADVDQICAAIKDLFEDTRAIAEPSGALSVAGMKNYIKAKGVKDKTLIAINCGANVNFDRLRHIAERANYSEAKEALYAVTIPEKPGSFRIFCEFLGKRNVTEFNYRYSDHDQARIFVGVALTNGNNERLEIKNILNNNDYNVEDLTDNDMAKLHTRHMVGGHLDQNNSEVIYRFEFPERPGALMGFLNKMGSLWNISLFHYRNHGSAFGRVLCGFQVPEKEKPVFRTFLETINYRYIEETQNDAYKKFLN